MSIELNLSTTLADLDHLSCLMGEFREKLAKRKSEFLARLDEFEWETDAYLELARESLERHAVALEDLKEGVPEKDRNLRLFQTQIARASKLIESTSYQSLFEEACVNGDSALVELLLTKPSVDPAAKNGFGLNKSLKYPAVIKLLLEDGRANPVDCQAAILYNDSFNISASLFLMDGRLDPFAVMGWGINAAILCDDADRLKALLADERSKQLARGCASNFISFAIVHGKPESLKILLDDERFVTAIGVLGGVILRDAIENNRVDCIKILLVREEFLCYQNKYAKTAIIRSAIELAQEAKLPVIVELLENYLRDI